MHLLTVQNLYVTVRTLTNGSTLISLYQNFTIKVSLTTGWSMYYAEEELKKLYYVYQQFNFYNILKKFQYFCQFTKISTFQQFIICTTHHFYVLIFINPLILFLLLSSSSLAHSSVHIYIYLREALFIFCQCRWLYNIVIQVDAKTALTSDWYKNIKIYKTVTQLHLEYKTSVKQVGVWFNFTV